MQQTNASVPSGVQAQHQLQLDAGHFLIQRCGRCQAHVYFPREVCPQCGALDLAFVEPSGAGTVYATTTVRRKADLGGDYNVCLVHLDEGVQLMARVDKVVPSAVTVGQRVRARVVQKDGHGVVVFDPQVAS
jgi:uncharacterized protein